MKNHKIESFEPMILMSASGTDIVGTDGADMLEADAANQTALGLGGNDVITGSGGSNVLLGGEGDDRLITVAGTNVVDGGGGYDILQLLNNNKDDFTVVDRGYGLAELQNNDQRTLLYNVEAVQFGDGVYTVEQLLGGGSGGNNPPVIVDPANTHISIAENTSFVVDVNATDLDGDNLTYSIGDGDDSALFIIDAQTGVLSFINAPDFENPLDSDGDNTYDVTVIVSDGTDSTEVTLWVTVTDVDEGGGNNAPMFTNVQEGEIIGVLENTTFVGNADATDADGDTLTYSIMGGDDADKFSINAATGEVMFKVAPDFETPMDADGDNDYEIMLKVEDGNGGSDVKNVTVRVKDVADGGNTPPMFTNVQEGEIVGVLENTTFVGNADATDADGDSLTYSIMGGDDADKFTINSVTGEVFFKVAPDFENPTDVDGDNDYEIMLKVEDGNGGSDVKNVTVRVKDVADGGNTPPMFTNVQEGEIVGVLENTTFVGNADATDADGDSLTYSIMGGDDADKFTINSATGEVFFKVAPDFENPTDVDGDNDYEIMLKVEDGNGGSDVKNVTVRVKDVADGGNTPPMFTNVQEGEIVGVLENTTFVGNANATDADGDTLTYSIMGGDDADKFTINSATGEVFFKVAPDFETPMDTDGDNDYEIMLKVEDGNGGSDVKNVTVRVKNVNDGGGGGGNNAPAFTNVHQNENVVVNEGTTLVGNADATDADGDTLTFSIVGGVDASLFVINPANGILSFKNAPDFENPDDADGDNFYELTLRVSDGQASEDLDIFVSVDDVSEGNNQIPRFTNVQVGDFANVHENTKFVGDADAFDADGDALSFSVVGGADASLFTINSQTGVLKFIDAPDFENPGDSDGDNSYGVIIRVSDGIAYQDRLVWVEVINTNS